MTVRFRLTSPLRMLLPAVLCATALLSAPAHALRLMNLRAEQLMIGAESIRKDLELTPNQQTLWQQTAAKVQALLRARQQRRDKLQLELKTALSSGVPDLRELNGSVEAEAASSAAEDRQLREWWLVVNDALTDKQRSQVIGLLLSQLDRVDADGPRGPGGGREGGREGGRGPGGPGGRGQRPGGGVPGMGGAGMGG